MDEKQLLWNRYSLHIEMYQKYLDIILKLNLFYYGITGAIISFYFSDKSNGSDAEYALVLPIIVSILLIVFFVFAIKSYEIVKQDIDILVNKLSMNHYVRVDALTYLLWGSIVLLVLSLLGLSYVLFIKIL